MLVVTGSTAGEAFAQDVCDLRAQGPAISWSTDTGPTALVVTAAPDQEVSVRFRVLLGGLEHTWYQGPYNTDATGRIAVLVEVPMAAFLHPAAADFVSDFVAMATVAGQSVRAPEAYMAWPDGASGAPALWTAEMQRVQAPNGVVDEALRAAALGPHDRIVPDLSDVLTSFAPPIVPLDDTGVTR